MQTQLFVGSKPEKGKILPIKNYKWRNKPMGGLWTSSLIDSHSSEWVEWCEFESFRIGERWPRYELEVEPTARIYTINSTFDLICAIAAYPHSEDLIDFESMVKQYDAIHLTSAGQQNTRFGEPNLCGWDCESTIWFRWCFSSISEINYV